MKIMFYINTISHGGAERVIVNLATQLCQRGHDCSLVTSYYTHGFEYPLGDGVERMVLGENRVENVLLRNFVYVRRLRKLIKRHEPDVVVSFLPEANYRALIAVMGLHTRVIISVRSDPNREYGSIVGRILANTLYKTTDGIVFQTSDAKAWFSSSIQKKGTIIYNQVGEQFYNQQLCKERRDIVAIGRLAKSKNYQMLIDAYAGISCGTKERLVIYGAGVLKDELDQKIKDSGLNGKVMLMGVTDDVPRVLRSAKIYVLSSDYEGMPNALMEAMAMGLPCVSTDCPCGGPRMLFSEALQNYLVPVNDSKAMGIKMQELLDNEEARERNGYACKAIAESFRPHVIIKQWETYIKEVSIR